MRNLKLIIVLSISLVLFQCEKDDYVIDKYLTATIDGNEYYAKLLKARKYRDDDGRKCLEISSASINSEQQNPSSDYEVISFSLMDDCLSIGTYDYEFILNESGIIIFSGLWYKYFDVSDNVFYGFSVTNGYVKVDEIDYKENGIIKGKFEFEVLNGTDTVQIKNGKFQLEIE